MAIERLVSRESSMSKVHIMDHPLIQHKIGIMRKKTTKSKEFRELASEIAMLICYEATRDLELEDIEIETPICTCTAQQLKGKDPAFIPILRAGLGMVDGMLAMVPSAKVAHIGLYRDERTFEAHEYFCKMPDDITERRVFVLDPMLATGGSAIAAFDLLKRRGVKNACFACMIAAPEGIEAFTTAHPDIDIYVGVVDEGLNENKYIVPGLGDAGDRIFGTK